MASERNSDQGRVEQVVGLVSSLGQVVKQRLGEFAAEANEQLRDGLSEAKKDLEDELKDASGEAEEEAE